MSEFDDSDQSLTSQGFALREETFASAIAELERQVQSEMHVEILLSDILPLAPSYLGLDEPEYDAVGEVISSLAERGIQTYPRLGTGTARKTSTSSVVLFKGDSQLDTTEPRLKSVLLFVKLGVAVAKADSVIDDAERRVILKSIEYTPLLTNSEIAYLQAAAIHIMSDGINRELLMNKLEGLRPDLKDALLELAMSVAVADGEIAKSEITVIQEIYKALDLNPRMVRGALNRYAADHHLELSITETPKVDFESLIEEDVSLDELLDEFTF